MTANLVNYEMVAEQARQEVSELNAPATTTQTLNQLIDAFVDLQQREYRNYESHWGGFALKIDSLDTDTYNRFQRVVEKTHSSPGRLLNHLMQLVLNREEVSVKASDLAEFMKRPSTVIQHMKSLEVTKYDLEQLGEGETIGFQHIHHLVIASDVNTELIKEKIGYIQHCKEVILPKDIPKLAVLSLAQFCKDFGFH